MHRPRFSALVVAAIPALVGTLGCYSYTPARDVTSLTGRRASIALTDSGSVVLAPRIGAGVIALEGDYLGDSAGMHLLAMTLTRQRDGQEADWKGEHVAVSHALVASLDERAFSASRSLLAGALGVAGAIALTLALRGKGESSMGGPPPGKLPGQ
ncbi:MAG: hypothetical protein ABJB78_09845 [Betaproteobacteria bacterium]